MNTSYFLSAILDRGPSGFELRTEVFSAANLEDLLREFPVAITLEPSGQLAARNLLQAFASGPGAHRTESGRWRVYRWMFDAQSAHWLTNVGDEEIELRIRDLHLQSDRALAAFVLEGAVADQRVSTAVDAAIAAAISIGRHGYDYSLSSQPEVLDRRAVLARRHSMLERVPTFSINEISGSFDLTHCNPSQRAADLRKARRLFGVRAGWAWRYPKFQFNASRHVHPEMRAVLAKLPDDLGWNRLEWFLTPHEALRGETPLTVWRRDRALVVAAAGTEHWHRRRAVR